MNRTGLTIAGALLLIEIAPRLEAQDLRDGSFLSGSAIRLAQSSIDPLDIVGL